MPDEEKASSLVDQIIAKTIEALTDNSQFNQEVLERLGKLVDSNDLTDSDNVVNALRTGADH